MNTDTATGNDHLHRHAGHDLVAPDGTVYPWTDDPDNPWGGHWSSEDRAVLNNAAVFARAGVDVMDLRGGPTRTARVQRLAPGTTLATVRALLPSNYTAIADGDAVVVTGIDVAGWTLDGYVLPRLASALIAATETTAPPALTDPLTTQR